MCVVLEDTGEGILRQLVPVRRAARCEDTGTPLDTGDGIDYVLRVLDGAPRVGFGARSKLLPRPVTSPPTIGRGECGFERRRRPGRACRRGTRTRHRSRGSRRQQKGSGTRSQYGSVVRVPGAEPNGYRADGRSGATHLVSQPRQPARTRPGTGARLSSTTRMRATDGP